MPVKADLTSVRCLITSVTELATACNVSVASVYRWIKVNRIPGAYLTTVCNQYDVEIRDLLPLTGSDKENNNKVLHKPKATLETLMKVYLKEITIEAAAEALDTSLRSLKLVMFHWGDELPTLYTTLKQLEEKRISLDEAAARLNVTKYTLHGIRMKYGYAPGKLKTAPDILVDRAKKADKKALLYEKAMDVLAGRITANQAAKDCGVSYRTLFRYTDGLTTHKLNDLSHWPASFRIALAHEIAHKLPIRVEKWLEFSEKHRLVLPKRPKYPKTPSTWQKVPLKRLIVAVLMDEASIEAVAASRGGDPEILASLFSSDLSPLGLTWPELQDMSVMEQAAVVDVLLAVVDRRRRLDVPNETESSGVQA